MNSTSGHPVGRRYLPGDATGISGPGLWLVVGRGQEDDVSRACYELVQHGGDVESVVDILIAEGLRMAPDFAICATQDGIRWRLLLRGEAQVEYGDGDWSQHLTCRGVLLDWDVEAAWVSLRLGPPRDSPHLPVTDDLSSVAELRVSSRPGSEEEPAPAPPVPTPPMPPPQLPVTPARVSAAEVVERPSTYDPLFPRVREPERAEPPSSDSESEGPERSVPGVPASPSRALAPDQSRSGSQPAPLAPAADPDQGRPGATPTAVPAAFIAAIPDFLLAGVEDGQHSVQQASPPPELSSFGAVSAGGADSAVPGSPCDRPAWHTSSVPTAVWTGSPVDEAPSRTVSRAELRRRQLAESGGVMVLSMRCIRGHVGPAFVAPCGVCGDAVPPQEPVEVPRPPLGRLVFETGDVMLLDRDVVLGRNPRVPDGHAAASPHLIKLHDPRQEVSAQHLLLALRDWHVVVTDLGSTNGTEMVFPDGRRLKLVAGHGTVAGPGSTIVLAEILTIRYEASR